MEKKYKVKKTEMTEEEIGRIFDAQNELLVGSGKLLERRDEEIKSLKNIIGALSISILALLIITTLLLSSNLNI